MANIPITLVSGMPGVGKTTWIRQQVQHLSGEAVYFAAGSAALPLDALHLALEFPQLQVLTDGQEAELMAQIETNVPIFIEVAFHLNPVELQQLLGDFECHWVSLAADTEHDELESYLWADTLISGQAVLPLSETPQLWRLRLDGQVWDPTRFDQMWQELLRGTYGNVYRAKALVEMPEGWSVYGTYTAGFPASSLETFDILALAQNLSGRPERLSGIEIVGNGLDTAGIKEAVPLCCLDDTALAAFQVRLNTAIAQGLYTL